MFEIAFENRAFKVLIKNRAFKAKNSFLENKLF
jgi:hypothetical protein